MGCCLDCLRPQADSANERTTLLAETQRLGHRTNNSSLYEPDIDDVNSKNASNRRNREKYYQSIVEDARGLFLNSMSRSRARTASNSQQEESRIRGTFMNRPPVQEISIALSPPSRVLIDKNSHPLIGSSLNANNTTSSTVPYFTVSTTNSSNNSNNLTTNNISTTTVISILSEPRPLSTDIDSIADEFGELISRHAYNVPLDDGDNTSTLIQFRPVPAK